MRRIMVITGIRSEYFLLEPLLEDLKNSQEFSLTIVATGAHLSPRFGVTVRVIERRFGRVERILSLFDSDDLIARVKGLGLIVSELSEIVRRLEPDTILTLGDREEALAAATVGAYMNVPVVHLGGGDRVIGNVDDHVRHAVTKLAHIHCAFTEQSARRIIQLGEEPWRVYVTGSPSLDGMRKIPDMELAEIEKQIGTRLGDNFLVVIQHPITSEVEQAPEQMRITMEAVARTGIPTIVINPNSDAGSRAMISVVEEYINKYEHIRNFSNLPREIFVNLLRRALCLLGNSSAGIHEAPFLRLPVINIGNRQKGREHSTNIIFVPFSVDVIVSAVNRLINEPNYRAELSNCVSLYGDGFAVPKIISVLEKVNPSRRLLYKNFMDLPYQQPV